MYISVVMLAYNSEKTIEKSIRSVLAQSYTDFEFVIINDCSTDETEKIIKKYAQEDARIRYHKNESNSGVAISRDVGVRISKGEYVSFVDSDDIWTEDKLLEQVKFIEDNPEANFVFTGSRFMDGDGNLKKYTMNVPETVTYKELLKQNIIPCSSVLIKRQYLEDVFVPDDSMHEDFIAWLKILKKGIVAYGINKPLLIYRLAAGSRSYNKFNAVLMTWRVYRHAGLGVFSRLYYMSFYAKRSLKKYFKIYKR